MKTIDGIHTATIEYTHTTFVSDVHRGKVETRDGRLDKISIEEIYTDRRSSGSSINRLNWYFTAKTFKSIAKMIILMNKFLVDKFGEDYGD